MSNGYFNFKQFTINQDRCAMKVSTDVCILGAWTKVRPDCNRILDIGTGTGLLALMMAQKTDAGIDAIELDQGAALQAKENVAASKWRDSIHVIHTDAVTYNYEHKYDCIITNPPFFNNSLLGNKNQRNLARHTLSLSYRNLFSIVRDNLAVGGSLSILLPLDEFALWEQLLLANKWHVGKKLNMHPREGQATNRVVAICQPGKGWAFEQEDLYIRTKGDSYTPEFAALLSPYYLDK